MVKSIEGARNILIFDDTHLTLCHTNKHTRVVGSVHTII